MLDFLCFILAAISGIGVLLQTLKYTHICHEVIYSLIMIVFVSAHFSQIEEVRLRLNVDVTVAPDSAPAPAPIETFTDMVDICVSLMRFRLSVRLVLLMGS